MYLGMDHVPDRSKPAQIPYNEETKDLLCGLIDKQIHITDPKWEIVD